MNIASLIILALYFWIFVFLVNLKNVKCDCAINWKRDYIMGFIGFVLLFNLYLLLVDTTKAKFTSTHIILAFLVVAAAILNIILMIQYTLDIQKNKCECADKVSLTVMQFLAFFQIFAIVLVLMLVIFLGMFLSKRP